MDQLKELFPGCTDERLQSALESAEGDVELAVAQLLSATTTNMEQDDFVESEMEMSENNNDDDSEQDWKLAALVAMFPDLDSNHLAGYLSISEWRLSEAIDAVLAAECQEDADQQDDAFTPNNQRPRRRRDRQQRSARRQVIHQSTGLASGRSESFAISTSSSSTPNAITTLDLSSTKPTDISSAIAPYSSSASGQQLREQARQISQERSELYQKAAETFRRSSGNLYRQVASYYAQEEIHRRNMEAAYQTVWENGQRYAHSDQLKIVDLHYLRIREAETVLEHELERWRAEINRQNGLRNGGVTSTMKVITGMGNHSAGRAPRLQPAVCQYLLRSGWKFEIGPGFFLVRPK